MRLEGTGPADTQQRQALQHELRAVEDDLEERNTEVGQFKSELELLQRTFGDRPRLLPQQSPRVQPEPDSALGEGDQRLQAVLGLALALLGLSVLSSFGQPQNHSLLCGLALLAVFLCNTLVAPFVRLCLVATGASLCVDGLWLGLLAGHWWHGSLPQLRSNHWPYKYCVVATSLQLLLKAAAGALLWGYRHAQQEGRWVVPVAREVALVLGGRPGLELP